jgi:uncharacterized protein
MHSVFRGFLHLCGLPRHAIPAVLLATLVVTLPSFADSIHSAASKGDLAKVKELLKQDPASIASTDNMGRTPLHVAAEHAQKDVVAYLLENGADVNAKDRNGGFTPLDLALSSFHAKDIVPLLLDKGADVNTASKQGLTPLDEVAMRGQKELVEMLLKHNAIVDARDSKGNTPLLWAILMGHGDVAQMLVNANADVNARNALGMTPLMLARRRDDGKLEKMLRDRGAHE